MRSPISESFDAPRLHVAHKTLRPKSTYSCPSTMPVDGFPVEEPSQELKHVSVHTVWHLSLQEEVQSFAQDEHVMLVEEPLHEDEQSEHPPPPELLEQES